MSTTPPARRWRIRPSTITLLVGVAFAAVTAASGIIATLAGTEDRSGVQREVFTNIPGPYRAIFYTVLPVLILAGAYLFSLRVRNWERGQPDNRRTTTRNVERRLRDFRA